MPNRLAESNSPYLLQHQDNPVAWQPWDREALEQAKAEQKPIFLSVGYAACHWCHVMEHESFEDPRIAELLNDRFVCIKVDREERPDIDQIYMQTVQAMTGQGGWPMSVFLTPEGRPFYGGTYYPPTSRAGMPGFDTVVNAVADAWESKRDQVLGQADQMTKHLEGALQAEATSESKLQARWIDEACEQKALNFDSLNGGFGSSPKFPHPMDLDLLLRRWHDDSAARWLNIVTVTLAKMADGGIYDHLGGGFARYSVDERWLVPHFEKMLYDNALLAGSYLRGYQATGNPRFAAVARETLEYLMRDMIDESGGIQSTEDADSEGVEGKYYVWTPDEVLQILGEERGEQFCFAYDVSRQGNFEGNNILNLRRPLEVIARERGLDFVEFSKQLTEDRAKLLAVRESRIRPGRDDKVLVAWNALAIDAFAIGSQVLGDNRMLSTALAAAEFIWNKMRREDGRLLHAFRRGTSHLDAYLDDYAYLINAFVSLFLASSDATWLRRAIELAETMISQFEDQEKGGFFFTASDHEKLILRTKDFYDSSVPSGNGEAAVALLRLSNLTGSETYRETALRTLLAAADVMTQQSMAASRLLTALHLYIRPQAMLMIAGCSQQEASQISFAFHEQYHPNTKLLIINESIASSEHLAQLVQDKLPQSDQPTLFRCEGSQCDEPVVGLAAILEAISGNEA